MQRHVSGPLSQQPDNGTTRPPIMPQRPGQHLLKKPSSSRLRISRSQSIQSLRLPELQCPQPTTSVSFESPVLGTIQRNSVSDNQSIYSLNNEYGLGFNSHGGMIDGDQFTIRTNPTLTIYSDDELESVNGAGFNERLEESMIDGDGGLSFIEDKEQGTFGRKDFFILSSAGKPIYFTSDDAGEVFAGVIQTVVSSFLLDELKLKSFVTEETRFTILNQSPIILMAVSQIGETEAELLNQLDLLHSFLLSTLSKPHIIKAFQNKEGFDLRKHLGRADITGLDLLCQDIMSFNPGILVGALQSLKLRNSTRDKIKKILLAHRPKSLLYGLVVGPGGRLINIMRPRNHTLHTIDLQILFSLVTNQGKSQDEELWLPICLPKFNANGFLYAYVKFVSSTALILLSADKGAFYELREAGTKMAYELKQRGLLDKIQQSLDHGLAVKDIPAPLIHHFIFKSKRHLQYIQPTTGSTSAKNLRSYYLKLHASVNRGNRISVSYLNWEGEGDKQGLAGLAWVTPNYELFLITGGNTQRDTLVSSAKAIASWCHKYEQRLFVCEGAKF